jgi:hypothetical protein
LPVKVPGCFKNTVQRKKGEREFLEGIPEPQWFQANSDSKALHI